MHITLISDVLRVSQIHQKIPAISVAADLWCIAFRCNFIPFWTHSSSHRLRAYRLDPVQYSAIHGLNSATQLTLLLSDQERMSLNRLALNTPAAGIMTLEEAATYWFSRHLRAGQLVLRR